MPEIDESQLANYRTLQEFVQRGLAHPEGRKLLKQAEKLLYPDRAVPEVDAAAEVRAEVDAKLKTLDEKMAALDAAEAKRKEEEGKATLARQWQGGRDLLRAGGYTDEGVTAVEKLMEERGIFDHEAAAALHEKMHPPPEPTTVGGSTAWNFFEKPADEGPLKNALAALVEGTDLQGESFLNAAIPLALREVRGR